MLTDIKLSKEQLSKMSGSLKWVGFFLGSLGNMGKKVLTHLAIA